MPRPPVRVGARVGVTEDDLVVIDRGDASSAEWGNAVGHPSLYAISYCADLPLGDGAKCEPADLDDKTCWTGTQTRGAHAWP